MWNSTITKNLSIYPCNFQTEKAIFIAPKHEKNNYGSYLNFYKCFLHFEFLASNTTKNETKDKFKNLLGINLVKYSSKFLAHIKKHSGHTGTPTNVQNNFINFLVSVLT